MTPDPDWELVARARSGDDQAFVTLIRRHERALVHFCQRMTRSVEDAEELAQESFVRVYRHLERLQPHAKFSTVLFGIARNLTLNFLRDAKRRGRGLTDSLTRDDASSRPLPDAGHRPDEAARLNEIEGVIAAALDRLSAEHREVLVLRELNGLDYDAIAAIVKCRKGTVKSRLARAREQLRQRVIELGGELL